MFVYWVVTIISLFQVTFNYVKAPYQTREDVISKFSFIHRPQKIVMYRELTRGNWTQEWINEVGLKSEEMKIS